MMCGKIYLPLSTILRLKMNNLKNIPVEQYNRPAICCHLDEFDPIFANESDFVEVCEWKNGEGYDITINERQYAFTHGELDAINYLITQLNKI